MTLSTSSHFTFTTVTCVLFFLITFTLLIDVSSSSSSSSTTSKTYIPFLAVSNSSTSSEKSKVCLLPYQFQSIASVSAQSATITIEEGDWDSVKFMTTIASILLRDALGFNVIIQRHNDQNATFNRIASSLSDANLEISKLSFPSQFFYYASTARKIEDAGISGYIQKSGWYIPTSFNNNNNNNNNNNLEYWKSLFANPTLDAFNQLPPSGSTPPSINSDTNSPFQCSDCLNGQFTPIQCSVDALTYCKELLHGPSTWSAGVAAQLINNLNLNLTISYLNSSSLYNSILSKLSEGSPFLFQLRQPSFVSVQSSNFTRLILPEYSPTCYSGNTHNSSGSVNCDFPADAVRKIVRSNLYLELPSAYLFLRRFSLDDATITTLLKKYSDHLLNSNTYPVPVSPFGELFNPTDYSHLASFWFSNDSAVIAEIACSWLRENEDIWSKWLPLANIFNTSSGSSSSDLTAYLAAPIISAAVLIFLTFLLIRRNRRQRHLFKTAIGKQWTLDIADITDIESPADANVSLANYKHQRVILTKIDWIATNVAPLDNSSSTGSFSSPPSTPNGVNGSPMGQSRNSTLHRSSTTELIRSSTLITPQTPQFNRTRLSTGTPTARASSSQFPNLSSNYGVTQKGYSKEIEADFVELKTLRHPNIVEFFGVTMPPKAYLVMEYMAKGSLRDMLEKSTIPLDMDFKASMALDIARGMDFLHSHKLAHKNLSSSNVLVDNRFVCKITGFGLSHIFSNDLSQEDESQLTWVAPEVLNWVHQERMMKKKFGHSTAEPPEIDWFKADVFSFGYILFEMLIGGEGPEQRERRMNPKKPNEDDVSTSSSSGDNSKLVKDKRKGSEDMEMTEVSGTVVKKERAQRNTIVGDANWKLYGSTHSLVDEAFLDLDPLDQRENDFLLLLKSCQDEQPQYRPVFSFVTRMLTALIPNRGLMENMASMLEIYSSHLEEVVDKRTEELSQEKQRAEALLHNILPKSIAEQLQRSVGLIANEHKSATVFFSDIVGFTTMSHNMPPSQVVTMLNQLFTEMDRLAITYGLEKIKTIGDAYMAACGVPTDLPDHIERVAMFALKAIGIKIAGVGGSSTVQMRMGIHTGPVTAGVVGTRKFAYDLWGDTVNTASRMESNGAPGRVCVSEAVYRALADKFKFEAREPMYVKGLGETRTYFLIEPLPHFKLQDLTGKEISATLTTNFRGGSDVDDDDDDDDDSDNNGDNGNSNNNNGEKSKVNKAYSHLKNSEGLGRISSASQETAISYLDSPSSSPRSSVAINIDKASSSSNDFPLIKIDAPAGTADSLSGAGVHDANNGGATNTSTNQLTLAPNNGAANPSRTLRTGRDRQASIGKSGPKFDVPSSASSAASTAGSSNSHNSGSSGSNVHSKNRFIDASGAVVDLALLVSGKDTRPISTTGNQSNKFKGPRPRQTSSSKAAGGISNSSAGSSASAAAGSGASTASSLSPSSANLSSSSSAQSSKSSALPSFLRKADGKSNNIAMSEADLQKWRQIQAQRRPSMMVEVVVEEH